VSHIFSSVRDSIVLQFVLVTMMIRACFAISLCMPTLTLGSTVGSPSDLPVLALNLVPPRSPFPEVTEQVHRYELAREKKESALQRSLKQAYDGELARANQKIQETVKSAFSGVSFLQQVSKGSRSSFRVKVSLTEPSHMDASIKSTVDAMEQKRSVLEQGLFTQAKNEMSALTSIVLAELERSLARKSSQISARRVAFLQSKSAARMSPSANVRIRAARFGFPRIADLIQEMQQKRDRVESQERKLILQLQLGLLQAENEMIVTALKSFA